MSNLFANFKQDILELFKSHYRTLINKNIRITFEEVLALTLNELMIPKASAEESDFLRKWFDSIHHHYFLIPFLEVEFTEIIFHSHLSGQILKLGSKEEIKLQDISVADFQLALEVLAVKNHVQWNFKEPFASFNLEINGFTLRCTLIHSGTMANAQSKIFLRKILNERPTLNLFDLSPETNELLISLIKDKKNILVSGGTGSGKTTLMRGLMNFIDPSEHLIVLEDTYEILNTHPGQTSFLSNKEQNNKSLKDYCAYSLRMSPDRLIVGEMRSTEVVPFLLAMNTGHKGLMSTIHASSAVDALLRISMLFSLFAESKDISFSLITKLVCKNIDYVVHMEHKKIKEICRIIGSEAETPFYERIYEA